jgi:hypothetical protein
MTYPTEFYQQEVTVGPTGLRHPYYVFNVNLSLNLQEAIGPCTNQKSVTVLHPDQHQTSPDLGRQQKAVRVLQNTTWFAGLLAAGNIEINDDGTITAYGAQGKYLNDTHTTGSNPLLTLVTQG